MTKEQKEIARLSWNIEEYKKYDIKQKAYIKKLKDKIAELELTIKSYEASFEIEEEIDDDIDIYKTKIENFKKEIRTLNKKLLLYSNSNLLENFNDDTLDKIVQYINKKRSINTVIKQLKKDYKHIRDIVYTFNENVYNNSTILNQINSNVNKLNELYEEI